MKKIIAVLAALTLVFVLKAQENQEFKTIIGDKELNVSGFISPVMSFSSIDGNFAHFMGGGGGVMINGLFIGGFGTGLTTTIPYKSIADNNLSFGYGGFWLGYNFMRFNAIHPTAHVRLGWGEYGQKHGEGSAFNQENCFVVEPTVEMEMNVFEFFKIGLGASYRYVTLVQGPYSSPELSGPAAFLSFKLGWFRL